MPVAPRRRTVHRARVVFPFRFRGRRRLDFPYRKVLQALGRGMLVALLLAVVGELGVRRFGGEPTSHHKSFQEFRPHPVLYWRLRPNLDADLSADNLRFHVRSNAVGLRSAEIPFAKPPNAYRILCLGDSITYGYGVQEGETYEARLQVSLRRRFPYRTFDVINGGCPGYSSYQGLQLLREVGLKYAPDLLIVGFIYADPATEAASDAARAPSSHIVAALQQVLYESRLYLALRGASAHSQMPTGPTDPARERVPRVSLVDFESNLRAFADIMRARGGHVVYLNPAKNENMLQAEKWLDPHQERYERYREVIRQVAQSTRNLYVDCDALLARNSIHFLDPIHPSAAGFDLMAQELAKNIAVRWLRDDSANAQSWRSAQISP